MPADEMLRVRRILLGMVPHLPTGNLLQLRANLHSQRLRGVWPHLPAEEMLRVRQILLGKVPLVLIL